MKFLTIFLVSLVILVTVTGYPQSSKQKISSEEGQHNSHSSETTLNNARDIYMDALGQETELSSLQAEPNPGSQNLYPSFSSFHDPPLGHSRPVYYQQEGAYSHRPSAYQQLDYDTNTRFSGYKGDTYSESSDPNDLLGSGNFAIIKGGTFYNDNNGESSNYDNYYYQNGHGRPSLYFSGSNSRPQKYQQFENFRDFADINTPSNPEYSQFVVVYANKNGTLEEVTVKPSSAPKNIIERLAMLDLELPTTTTETVPTKKLSTSKRKLALTFPEKKLKLKYLLKNQMTSPRDLTEPLLALS